MQIRIVAEIRVGKQVVEDGLVLDRDQLNERGTMGRAGAVFVALGRDERDRQVLLSVSSRGVVSPRSDTDIDALLESFLESELREFRAPDADACDALKRSTRRFFSKRRMRVPEVVVVQVDEP
ncbi:MAG: hypothetical protein R3A47_11520 [Polyangiales bacterium]